MLGPCGAGQRVKSNAAWAAGYWRMNSWVVGRQRCAEWSGGLQAVNAAWASGRPERCRGPFDCRRVRGACASGWPEVRRVVLLLLLARGVRADVVRGVVPQLAVVFCWSVGSVMLSINQCYSRRGHQCVALRRGHQICGVLWSVME